MPTKPDNNDERRPPLDHVVEERRPTSLNESARVNAVPRASAHSGRVLMLMAERVTAQAFHTLLREAGYRVDCADTCAAGVQRLADLQPDLILTDLALHDRQGADLCGHLRKCSAAAVMVVTPIDDEDTCAAALGAGADDYVVTPVRTKVFVARVAALVRRAKGPSDGVVAAGDITIDLRTRDVIVGSRRLRLRPHEFDLMIHLVRHPSTVLSHRTLLAAVWGPSVHLRPHYVRMCVAHLRRQIEPTPERPREVSLRGSDFIFDSVDLEALVARCSLAGTHDGLNGIRVPSDAVDLPLGLRVEGISPRQVSVRLTPTTPSSSPQ